MALTDIADRLTPSVPIEISFAAQQAAVGRKYTTLIGHMAASPGSGVPYSAVNVVNVGDPDAAKAEVEALAGVGAQVAAMAYAFVNANAAIGNSNFPAFRVVLLPHDELHFGPNHEAIDALKLLRSDMLVSCYPAGDATNRATLIALAALISGPDRDLNGQFGSFVSLGSIEPLTTQVAYAVNDRQTLIYALPDSNTDLVPVVGTVVAGSNVISAVSQTALTPTGDTVSSSTSITNLSSTAGIYPGAAITGTGIPAGAKVQKILSVNSIQISLPATSSNTTEMLSITNLPTAGIYPGAQLSGTGIPAGAVVQSVAASAITMSVNASASGSAETIAVQNVISQAPEIVAAACSGGMMSSAQPYNPLQNVTVGGLVAPQKPSDWIAIDPAGASEAALVAGLSPLTVKPGKLVGFIRTRVTYNTLPGNIPVASYFDWQELVTLYDFREVCYGVSQNPPFNNNPGGTKASVKIAGLFKDEILREAQAFEDAGMFQGVKTLAPLFVVSPSTTSRGRFDFKIPVNVLPGLMVIAGNIEAQSVLGNFTL